jgi:hypothetical protein
VKYSNSFFFHFSFISGMMLGIEFYTDQDEEGDIFYTIIDLLIIRLMIIKE